MIPCIIVSNNIKEPSSFDASRRGARKLWRVRVAETRGFIATLTFMRRLPRLLIGLVAAALFTAVGLFAGWLAFRAPVPETSKPAQQVTVPVVEATVGRSLTLTVTVTQKFDPIAVNNLSGIVTSVNRVDSYATGDLLYSVANVPVWIAEGKTPFYRDLALGAVGEDVTQLQKALTGLGYTISDKKGTFGVTTEAAVKKHQKDQGTEQTGVVVLGSVIAVPVLPSPYRLSSEIWVGAVASPGTEVLSGVNPNRTFELIVTPDQASLVPPQAAVRIQSGAAIWDGVIAGATQQDAMEVLGVTSPSGGPPCLDECGTLPVAEKLTLPCEVIVVPDVTGPSVPVAAVATNAAGETYVTLENGDPRVVQVLGSADGRVVISGVTPGEIVKVGVS